MKNKKSCDVCIVGSGWVAENRHIPAFQRSPFTKVRSICNPNKKSAASLAEKKNVGKVYGRLDKALESECNIISICTPPGSHYEIAKKAIDYGKNVLIEKPVTLKSEEAKRLRAKDKKNASKICPSHNFLFSRSFKYIKNELKQSDENVLHVQGIQMSSESRRLPSWHNELPGGLFFDESPHFMYLIDYLLPKAEVKKSSVSENKKSKSNSIKYNAKMANKRRSAEFWVWFGALISEWWLVVHTDKRILAMDIFRDFKYEIEKESTRNKITVYLKPLGKFISYLRNISIKTRDKMMGRNNLFGTQELVDKFASAVLYDGNNPVKMSQGLRTIKNIEKIVENS